MKYKRGYSHCQHCDKDLYRTRKEARRQARSNHPEKVLNAYYCPLGKGYHYGGLPEGGRDKAREILQTRWNRYVRKYGTESSPASVAGIQTGLEERGSLVSGEESRGDVESSAIGIGQVLPSGTLEGTEDEEVD